MDPPLSEARSARPDDLLELLHALRKDLERRGEKLPTTWTEEAVDDLRQGRLTGWYRPATENGGEIGFYSVRPERIFGHVHVLPGPRAVERSLELLHAIGDAVPCRATPLNAGISGLSAEDEERVAQTWAGESRRAVTRREGLERSLGPPTPRDPGPPPGKAERRGIAEVTDAALVDLDLRGFAGSEDADLFARDDLEYARMLRGILDGRLGRFLPEASCALVTPEGRLAAFILTVELSPRVGLFADVVVDPALRRLGYGRHLLEWGFRALSALGHESVRLWVTESNGAARQLYRSLGFQSYARSTIFRQAPAVIAPQAQRAR